MSGAGLRKTSPQLQLKESLKSGVRVKLDLDSIGLENLAVCVTPHHPHVLDVLDLAQYLAPTPYTPRVPTPTLSDLSHGNSAIGHSITDQTSPLCDPASSNCSQEGSETVDHPGRLLHRAELSETACVSALVGAAVSQSLYVRERPRAAMLDYSASPRVYVPVIADDERTMRFAVVLHVPGAWHQITELVIKTIDETLVVRGGGAGGEVHGVSEAPRGV